MTLPYLGYHVLLEDTRVKLLHPIQIEAIDIGPTVQDFDLFGFQVVCPSAGGGHTSYSVRCINNKSCPPIGIFLCSAAGLIFNIRKPTVVSDLVLVDSILQFRPHLPQHSYSANGMLIVQPQGVICEISGVIQYLSEVLANYKIVNNCLQHNICMYKLLR